MPVNVESAPTRFQQIWGSVIGVTYATESLAHRIEDWITRRGVGKSSEKHSISKNWMSSLQESWENWWSWSPIKTDWKRSLLHLFEERKMKWRGAWDRALLWCGTLGERGIAYWWTEITLLHKKFNRLSRIYQREEDREVAHVTAVDIYQQPWKRLNTAIKTSKRLAGK